MALLRLNEFGARVPAREVDPLRAEAGGGPLLLDSWRIIASLTLLLFVETLIAFHQTLWALVTTWYGSRTFSHCFLVFPLSVYLIWRRRKQLVVLQPIPNLWGLLLLMVLGFLWILGNLGEVRLLEEWAFVGILVALFWTVLGSSVVRALEFPLAFLVFAVPFGLGLIGPLQDATAWFTVHALNFSGIPAVLENRVLSVPTATWTVAEACSGIRYLFSSIMLGVIYAWIVYRSRNRRLLFVCASVVVPILANGVRAYGIVLLAYLSNNRLAADVDHIVYGWLFFTIVQLALFVVGLRWRQAGGSDEVPSQTSFPGSARHTVRGTTFIAVSLAAMIIAGTPILAMLLWNRATASAAQFEWPDPPVTVTSPWLATPAYDMSWAPALRARNRDFVQSYISGSHRVDLYWALYSGQRGFELLNSYNRIANPKVWMFVVDNFRDEVINGNHIRLRRTLIQSGPVARSVWTWYSVNGEHTGNPWRVKFLQIKARLLGMAPPTCVLAIGTDSSGNASADEAVLRDFLAHTSFLNQDPATSAFGTANNNARGTSQSVHNVSH